MYNESNNNLKYDPITGQPIDDNPVEYNSAESYSAGPYSAGSYSAGTNPMGSNPSGVNPMGAGPVMQNNPANEPYIPLYPNIPTDRPLTIEEINYINKQQQKIHDNNSPQAKKICFASLICWLISKANFMWLGGLSRGFEPVIAVLGFMDIIAYVLVIVALVKYPKNTWARVLGIIYLIEVIIFFIAAFFLLYAIISCINDCGGMS